MSTQAGNMSRKADNPKDHILKVSYHYLYFWLKYSFENVWWMLGGWVSGWCRCFFVNIKDQKGWSTSQYGYMLYQSGTMFSHGVKMLSHARVKYIQVCNLSSQPETCQAWNMSGWDRNKSNKTWNIANKDGNTSSKIENMSHQPVDVSSQGRNTSSRIPSMSSNL